MKTQLLSCRHLWSVLFVMPLVACSELNRTASDEESSVARGTSAPASAKTQTDWNPPIIIDPAFSYHPTTKLPAIDEGQIQRVIYVDQKHPHASDDNPGTANLPLQTISAAGGPAVNAIMAGIPTKIKIGPGLYREKPAYAFQLPKEATDTQRQTLFIIAGTPGETVISGAIEHEDGIDFRPGTWKRVEGEEFLYVHDWPYVIEPNEGPWINNYGFALLPRLLQRSEMIWVDGQRQRQVLAERYRWEDPDGVATMLDPGPGIVDESENNQPGKLVYDGLRISDPSELTEPGTFAVFSDPETPEALRGKLFLKLDRNISEVSAIEAGHWSKPWAPILVMSKRENFIVRDIDFTQNMASYFCPALVVANAKNFIIEDCTFNHNASRGFNVARSSQGIVRRCEASDNAGNGMGAGGGTSHVLFEDITTNFNNWRGAWEAFLGWDASGFKSGGVHNITVRRHTSIGNYANGIWYDVYCTNILIEDSFYLGNQRMGVMIEFTRPNGGPQVLRNSIVAFNRTGVFVTMAANSVVENNLVMKNQEGHIERSILQTQLLYKFHQRKGGPMNAADWESVRITNNIFAASSGSIVDYMKRKSNPPKQFPFILEVLTTNNNQYWLPTPDHAFHAPDGEWLTFAGWKQMLARYNAPGARDADSTWAPVPWEKDPELEFTEAANSPVTELARQMGVPLPELEIHEYWTRVSKGLYEEPHIRFDRQFD